VSSRLWRLGGRGAGNWTLAKVATPGARGIRVRFAQELQTLSHTVVVNIRLACEFFY
jgi:hypothetical protein